MHPVPDAALDDRLGWFGTAGSGKTYNAGSSVERLLRDSKRVVIPDPLGVWWGLRLDASGGSESRFDVVIFGGPHGDLPLNEHVGGLIGETVAGMKESCILDLSGLGTKAAERRFMLAFLTALYKNANGEPVHVVFDEADMWAPQQLRDKEGEAAKLLGMMETLVRRGRVKGFIPWLISQRPAVLNKDVLSQVDGLVAFKLTSVQDRDALGDWVQGQADIGQWREIWKTLPTMERGHGVVWLPSRSTLKTVSFPLKVTFDSSRTPKRGETVRTAALKPLNLDRLRERMSAVEVEKKANDPAVLKAEIARLKREVQNPHALVTSPEDLDNAHKRGYSIGHAAAAREYSNAIALFLQAVEVTKLERLTQGIEALRAFNPGDAPVVVMKAPALGKSTAIQRAVSQVIAAPTGDLTRPQQRVINSLLFWRSVGQDAPCREQVAAVAGYAPGSGNFNNLIGGLHSGHHVAIPQPGHVALANGAAGQAMTADEAREMMLSVLKGPQRKLVSAMTPGEDMTRSDLALAVDYAEGSGNFNNIVGSLCTLDIFRKPSQGRLALSDWAAELLA